MARFFISGEFSAALLFSLLVDFCADKGRRGNSPRNTFDNKSESKNWTNHGVSGFLKNSVSKNTSGGMC